jgi:hypothetical protein
VYVNTRGWNPQTAVQTLVKTVYNKTVFLLFKVYDLCVVDPFCGNEFRVDVLVVNIKITFF